MLQFHFLLQNMLIFGLAFETPPGQEMKLTSKNVMYYKRGIAVACTLTLTMIGVQIGLLSDMKSVLPTSQQIPPYRLHSREPHFVRTCHITHFQIQHMRKDDMQNVEYTEWTFVYSAYYDSVKPNVVKIVGTCQMDIYMYHCQVWYNDNNKGFPEMKISNATVVFNNFHTGRRGLSCYIICPVEDRGPPYAVSVVLKNECTPANNMIKVTYIGQENYTRNFTMCLCPLHDYMNNSDLLIEWIEFNRILGADNFIVYNFTSRQNLHEVINFYVKLGILELFQWTLPRRYGKLLDQELLDHYSQPSAYNDCLLRSKATSKYVVITDLDEYIVPRLQDSRTWSDMLKTLPDADAYTFRNSFFPLANIQNKAQDLDIKTTEKYNIMSLSALQRHKTITIQGKRTKYITRTKASFNVRTHSQMGAVAFPVDPKVGLMHHYRRGDHLMSEELVKDQTVLNKYGQELPSRVAEAWSNIKKRKEIIKGRK